MSLLKRKGFVLFAFLGGALLLGGCVPEIPEHPPPSVVRSFITPPSSELSSEGCVFIGNQARTVIVRILLLDGSFWRGASNGDDKQVFRRSINPIWTSGVEVPLYGEYSMIIEYRMDCDPCCGPFGGPVFIETYPFDSQRPNYYVGGGVFRFDHCEDCF